MREADSSPDGPFRHSHSRSERAPCYHLIRPFYWFHNHLCMLKDMSKCTSDISDHMKATRMGMITYHLSSLLYKTHLSETFRMFFQYLLAFTACALSSGSHKRINVHGWKCTRVKLFACCIWVYLAPFTIVWRWWRGVAWDSPLFLSI